MSIEARLRDLHLELPAPPKPMATYATAARHGESLPAGIPVEVEAIFALRGGAIASP
jgi:hypothetical protein